MKMVIASVWDVRMSVSGTQERVGLIDRGQRSSPDMFFANVIPVSTQSSSMLAGKCVSVC